MTNGRLEWCDNTVHLANGCKSALGGWHCVTCHTADVHNNMMASSHVEMHPDHVVGWSCGEHMRIEKVVTT